MTKEREKFEKSYELYEYNKTTYDYTNMKHHTRQQCIKKYGFYCNPSDPPWIHIKQTIMNLPPTKYFNQPSINNFHNLCPAEINPPEGTALLLTLGSKFCVQKRKATHDISENIERLRKDIRTHYHFRYSPALDLDDNFNPRLFVPSK